VNTTHAYRVEHSTRYVYSTPVATSQHVACLRPRELPYQHVERFAIDIDPAPAWQTSRVDYFGNAIDQFQLLRPHSSLVVSSAGTVEVSERDRTLVERASPRWEDVRMALIRQSGVCPPDVAQFVSASAYAPISSASETMARRSFASGRPIVSAALDLMHDIHRRFEFDATATTVTTPLSRVIEEERGVCQDFAHVALACFRSLGLAARYVSGYLLTDPPAGQPRLIGADASHAWVSVFCPAHGWVDLDPTNDVIVGVRHITIGWGRDYGDVSPLRGVLLGGAEHELFVGVSVVPADDEPAPRAG
jgi:transglutaminase-like putative cysteine protease